MARIDARRVLALVAFPLLLAGIAAPAVIYHREIWRLFSSTTALREWVSSTGALAPLVFVAVQALQVVVFVIPGEVPQIAGGWLFGPVLGTLLSLCGILAGSAVAFFLARLAGMPFVRALFPGDQVDRIGRLLGSRGARVAFFLLFLIPGIPKDVLTYVAGLTPIKPLRFALLAMIARFPGILISSYIGAHVEKQQYGEVIVASALAVALFIAGIFLRERIISWLHREKN
jgi:uncharacterized membrane protein YdjX (TVP38/TMEM64 family)